MVGEYYYNNIFIFRYVFFFLRRDCQDLFNCGGDRVLLVPLESPKGWEMHNAHFTRFGSIGFNILNVEVLVTLEISKYGKK